MPPSLYGGSVIHSYLGSVAIKKLYGSGPVSVGTQINIPHCQIGPRYPRNVQYYGGVNSSANLSGYNLGKQTPSVQLQTVVKTTSWYTANLINSLILSIDSYGDSDVWAMQISDGTNAAVWDGGKFMAFSQRQIASGGATVISLAFLSMYGDSENPGDIFTATTFTSTSVDPGYITDCTQVGFGSSANLVSSFELDIVRPQSFIMYDVGQAPASTFFPQGIASGMLTGNLRVVQSTLASEVISTSGTLNIGSTGVGVAFSLLVYEDEIYAPMDGGLRMQTASYSGIDISGGGIWISATAM